VLVDWGARHEIAAFDEVDEVWTSLDALPGLTRDVTIVTSLRLVLQDGSTRWIPTSLPGADAVARAVFQQCSRPLQAQAIEALRAGETLTFGPVQLDRTRLRGGSWTVRWEELSLLRFGSGRLALFRGQRIVPWRTIRLDRVPHPLVLVNLLRHCAPGARLEDPSRLLA
jgi:hypothetical protein